jgi:hypothetical protein
VVSLSEIEGLLCQFPGDLELRSHQIKHPESPQHLEQLGCVSHLLTQFSCPGIDKFYLWGRLPFGGD